MHHPVPSDVTEEQLTVMADELRAQGWNAEVAPTVEQADDSPLGIRITSEE